MPIYKYEPYYRYDGPSLSRPLREELTPDEITYNLECFYSEIYSYFEDDTAKFKKFSDKCIGITSDISEVDCDARVKKCLNHFDLYAHKQCRS